MVERALWEREVASSSLVIPTTSRVRGRPQCQPYGSAIAKTSDAFSIRDRASGRRHHICRDCFGVYSRAYYAEHREAYRRHRRRNIARYRLRNKYFVIDFLATHPCIDCGEPDVAVLEFDHVLGRKRKAVAQLVLDAVSLNCLKAEIAKCVVRCANCHRRKTGSDLRWYKSRPEMSLGARGLTG